MAWSSRTLRTRFGLTREKGQTMTEYAVILGVITPAVVLAFAMLGDAIVPLIDRVIGFLS